MLELLQLITSLLLLRGFHYLHAVIQMSLQSVRHVTLLSHNAKSQEGLFRQQTLHGRKSILTSSATLQLLTMEIAFACTLYAAPLVGI